MDEQDELLSQSDLILTLIAFSGELPTTQITRLSGGEAYKQKVIKRLKADKLIRTFYKDGLRGYRLTSKAKERLLCDNTDRFSFFFTGESETNHIKSEITRRLRLHRLAETNVTMFNADVELFRDKKASVFTPIWTDKEILLPAFYSSREIKELGTDSTKIRGSRAMGALLGEDSIYAVYSLGESLMKWEYKAEMRFKMMMRNLLCQERLEHIYDFDCISGLILANTMTLAGEILSQPRQSSYFLIEGGYEHFYFLTCDRRGERILTLLCHPEIRNNLDEILTDELHPASPTLAVENDALDADGNPVLLGYTCDLPRLSRFDLALQNKQQQGTVICFDFQKEVLEGVMSKTIHFQTISFEKWERIFFEEE